MHLHYYDRNKEKLEKEARFWEQVHESVYWLLWLNAFFTFLHITGIGI